MQTNFFSASPIIPKELRAIENRKLFDTARGNQKTVMDNALKSNPQWFDAKNCMALTNLRGRQYGIIQTSKVITKVQSVLEERIALIVAFTTKTISPAHIIDNVFYQLHGRGGFKCRFLVNPDETTFINEFIKHSKEVKSIPNCASLLYLYSDQEDTFIHNCKYTA